MSSLIGKIKFICSDKERAIVEEFKSATAYKMKFPEGHKFVRSNFSSYNRGDIITYSYVPATKNNRVSNYIVIE